MIWEVGHRSLMYSESNMHGLLSSARQSEACTHTGLDGRFLHARGIQWRGLVCDFG